MQGNLKHCAYSRSFAVSRHADERHSASRGAFSNESRGPQLDGRFPFEPNGSCPFELDGRCPFEPNGSCPSELDGRCPFEPNGGCPSEPNGKLAPPLGHRRVVCGPLAPTRRPESPTSNSRISPDGAFEPSQTALLGQPKPAPSGQPRPGPSGEPVPSLLSPA